MKFYDWSEEKNELLKRERGVSFQDVISAIENDRVLDVLDHPNKERYPNQKMYVVKIEDYVYLAPFVEDGEKIFLKTVFPSRKKTKEYLGIGRKKK